MPETKTVRMPQKRRPTEVTTRGGQNRWSPDARTREAVRVLVAQLAPLDEDQKTQLRALLAPAAEGGA